MGQGTFNYHAVYDRSVLGAACIAKLGVGPKSVSYHHLTAETLAAMIHQTVADTAMHQTEAEIGQRIENEDGAGKAVDIIEHYLAKFQAGSPDG